MKAIKAWAVASAMVLVHTTASAQTHTHTSPDGHTVALHVSSRWKECSFQLDPSLTQAAWHQFTREAGVVTYFKPLADARPMGAGKFEVSLLQWETGIDANDAAWNDTFVHPDAEHWLFEGDGLKFPGAMVRAGVTSRTDVGVYATKNPNANYGFYGLQLQQNLASGSEGKWAASTRVSFVSMFGPEDLNFSVYGADLVASRQYGLLSNRISVSPYAGVSATLSRSHEKTTAVNLADENVLGAQGMLGAVAQIGPAKIAAEYGVASVRSLSLKVGFGTR